MPCFATCFVVSAQAWSKWLETSPSSEKRSQYYVILVIMYIYASRPSFPPSSPPSLSSLYPSFSMSPCLPLLPPALLLHLSPSLPPSLCEGRCHRLGLPQPSYSTTLLPAVCCSNLFSGVAGPCWLLTLRALFVFGHIKCFRPHLALLFLFPKNQIATPSV